MAHIKIFSGSEIMAFALQERLKEEGISAIQKNNILSGTLAGFGTSALAVDLFIDGQDFETAEPVIEDFLKNT
ncbi:MAG TPA: DUF2007 domain-containing protein [Flavobacterium sp.]|jgi:hypothetical protein